MSELPIRKRRPKLSQLVKSVRYGDEYKNYVPSTEALQYVNLNKLIYGEMENETPVAHYQMFDEFYSKQDSCVVAARGMAKSTFVQNLFFYVAIFGELPTIGSVDFMMYISDTVENGVRTMTEAMRFTYESSEFLKEYLPKCKFNETRWSMENADGKSLIVRCYGAESGIRGGREKNKRPVVAIIDDVLNDKNAVSPAKLRNIRNTVFKAIKFAMHPKRKKVFLLGTPFHDKCIVSQAVQSGNFSNLILPICEKFPCTREDFRGAWEDRFSYDDILDMYSDAENNSEMLTSEQDEDEDEGGMTLEGFYQEMMLSVDGDKLRVIDTDRDFKRIHKSDIMANREAYNFYITTDFATKDKDQGDLSFILVWAYDDNNNLFIVDGMCGHNLMTYNIDYLFELVEKYKPLEVGIETSGQQGGFVSWLEREMVQRDVFFTIVQVPSTINKLTRFMVVVPKIQAGKFWFTYEEKGLEWRIELEEELNGVTKRGGFSSEFDDGCDCISQIDWLTLVRPYYESRVGDSEDDIATVVANRQRVFNHNNDMIHEDRMSRNSYIV